MSALLDKIAGRRVIASVSGGKDSAAMCLHLMEMGIPHDRVFLDTGWEHPVTYEYLRGPMTEKLGPIVEVKAPVPDVPLDGLSPRVRAAVEGGSAMVARVLKKGMFPSKRRRFCTQELKVFPMRDYLRSLIDDGDDVINAVGIRAAESEARSKLAEWEDQPGFDCDQWRPLLRWSKQDVIDIHARHGLAPNPLYLRGASRVGCWPCIYARKSEIKFISEHDQERIELIRELEVDVWAAAARRAEIKGNPRPTPPTWFQAPIGGTGECWSIDRMVQWSRTLRGGNVEDRRMDMLEAMRVNDGCLEWNLCETAPDEGEVST